MFYRILKSSLIVVLFASIFGCASNGSKSSVVFDLIKEADVAYEQRRWFEASIAYEKVTQLVPDDHYAWFRLANTQLRAGDIDTAIYIFHEAIKRNPDHAKTHFNLSIAYILKAVESLEESGESLRNNDPGQRMIAKRVESLRNLIDQPTDTRRLNGSQYIRFGSNRS